MNVSDSYRYSIGTMGISAKEYSKNVSETNAMGGKKCVTVWFLASDLGRKYLGVEFRHSGRMPMGFCFYPTMNMHANA